MIDFMKLIARSMMLVLAGVALVASGACTRGEALSDDRVSAQADAAVESDAAAQADPAPSAEVLLPARIRLAWQTETESNTFGYFVYRADAEDGEMVCITAENPIHAVGNTTIPANYVFYDLDVEVGVTYFYKLQSRDLDGSSQWIVGRAKPVVGKAKRLSAEEAAEIEEHGTGFRIEMF